MPQDSALTPPASPLDRARLAWLEHVWDRVRGRQACDELASLLRADAAASTTRADVDRILRIVIGRLLTRNVVGDDRWRQSLTDFFNRGRMQATHLLPYVQAGDTILEYGGGVGRLGRTVRPHVRRLVSVDVNPLMAAYGRRLNPGIEFLHRDELADAPDFDGAYSVAVFFHLPVAEQRRALEYVHQRLKPGGWFLVDLQIGAATEIRDRTGVVADYGPVRATSLDDFRAAYEPLFSARRVSLFNAGFLLTKPGGVHVATEDLAGRHGVNEASIVYDVLEGEVVVVNLDSGSYYIMQGTASPIWQQLAAGRRVDEIVDGLATAYPDVPRGDLQAAVEDFLAQVMAESLLVPASAHAAARPVPDMGPSATAPQVFTAPVMYRYTDMQALIQMDPIREFDESGWPRRPAPRA